MGRKQNKHKKEEKRVAKGKVKEKLIGRLDVSKSGMGFVVIPNQAIDVRIIGNNFAGALHGDDVEVAIFKIGKTTGRPEGEVVHIVNRNNHTIIGRVEVQEHFAFVVPSNECIRTDIFVPLHYLNGATHGDKVVVGNIEYNKKKKNPNGEILEVVTGVRESDIAMKEIILDAGFPLSFSKMAIKESEKMSTILDEKEIAKRKDFRKTLTFTIDPADAKDFDDAISFKEIKKGLYEIGVHIADVSHYVKEGTELDAEAYARATSVYLPDRVNPMLPEKISNELCSLRPHEDKFTFSCVFEINSHAQIQNYWIGRTVTHSVRRYTYEEAQQIIEGEEGDYKKELLLIHGISQTLRKNRFAEGAINFSSTEVRFILNKEGEPIGITTKTSKEANQFIEELMLLANKTVAKFVDEQHVKNKPVPFSYRVHDAPDTEKLRPFLQFAHKYGHTFNMTDGKSIATSFNKMLASAKGKPEQLVLETLGIRTMQKAFYTQKNIGHYGLAFPYYCHFTSPIRRYPDVMVHRIVQQCLDKKIIPDDKIEEKNKHCSDQERKAMNAERDANKYKQVEFMRKHIGEEFEGVISGVSRLGFWVETLEHKCEGLVSMRNLAYLDFFNHAPDDYAIIGERTKMKFAMGDAVKIKVASANLDKREMDFELIVDNMELPARNLEIKKDKSKARKIKFK